MRSPGHHDNMLNSAYESAGIGHTKGVWVLMLGKACPEDADKEACRMTGDFGDASLNIFGNDEGSTGSSSDDGRKELDLGLIDRPTAEVACPTLNAPRRLRPRGRLLRFTTGVRPSFDGTLRVGASRGRRRARVTAMAIGDELRHFTLRFPSAGRWRVKIGLVNPTGTCSHSLSPRAVIIDR